REKASALVDKGALLEDHLGRAEEARQAYEEAIELDPTCAVAAFMLERHAWRSGDSETALRCVDIRARQVVDEEVKGGLLVDLAAAAEEKGLVDESLRLYWEAARLCRESWSILEGIERVSRAHGRPIDLSRALRERAKLVEDVAQGKRVIAPV